MEFDDLTWGESNKFSTFKIISFIQLHPHSLAFLLDKVDLVQTLNEAAGAVLLFIQFSGC